MRQKLSILLALPVANALSLANFQSITSVLIPINCQLVYDGQISGCQVSDFNTGCTPACVAGLNEIAKDVISACKGVSVTASSLLGIIQAGNIQEALCPTLAKSTTSTTTTKAKTTKAQSTGSVNAVSVTIPTDSAGVTDGLGFTSSTTVAPATTTSSTHAQSTSSATVKSTTMSASSTLTTAPSAAPSSTPPLETAGSVSGGLNPSTSDKGSVATSSSNSKTTTKAQPTTGGSGGGSPFDISSSADRVGGNSRWGFFVFATCAGILLSR